MLKIYKSREHGMVSIRVAFYLGLKEKQNKFNQDWLQ